MSGKSNSAQIMFFVLLVSLFSSVNFSADSFVMEISENLDSLNDSSIVKSNQNDSSVSDQWSFETGGAVEPVAISDDGRYIVGGSDDFGVYLFESASSQKMWEYSARGQIREVSISADGKYIVAGGIGSEVILFNKDSDIPVWIYDVGGPSDHIYTVSISANGEHIVAGSKNGKVYLFDKESNIPIWEYQTSGESGVWSVEISANGESIVASSRGFSGGVYLFGKNNSTPVWSSSIGSVYSVSISANQEYIAAEANSVFYLYGRNSSVPLWNYTIESIDSDEDGIGDDSRVNEIAFSKDGSYIAAASNNDRIYLFHKDDGVPIWDFDTEADGFVASVAISANGDYIAAGASNNIVYVFSKYNSNPAWSNTLGGWAYSVDLSDDGFNLVSGSSDNSIYSFQMNPDFDSDGVDDVIDECLGTVDVADVNENGCSWQQADVDGDGVLNPDDNCHGLIGACSIGTQYVILDSSYEAHESWYHSDGSLMILKDTDESQTTSYQVINSAGDVKNLTGDPSNAGNMQLFGYSSNSKYVYSAIDTGSRDYPKCTIRLFEIVGDDFSQPVTLDRENGNCVWIGMSPIKQSLYVVVTDGEIIEYTSDEIDLAISEQWTNSFGGEVGTVLHSGITVDSDDTDQIFMSPEGRTLIIQESGTNTWILDTISNSLTTASFNINCPGIKSGFLSESYFFDCDQMFELDTGTRLEIGKTWSENNLLSALPWGIRYQDDNIDHSVQKIINPANESLDVTIIGCQDADCKLGPVSSLHVSPNGEEMIITEGGGTYWYAYLDSDLDEIPNTLDTCPNTPIGSSVNSEGCTPDQVDSDGDGVYDSQDLCDGTVVGTAVDSSGCASNQLDSDADGISDASDQCQNTPDDESVGLTGCSSSQIDSDNDGVYDSQDNCPSTPPGTTVDSTGCAPDDVVDLDSDGDGVRDSVDACPNSATGIIVDSTGCETSGDVQENEKTAGDTSENEELAFQMAIVCGALLLLLSIASASFKALKNAFASVFPPSKSNNSSSNENSAGYSGLTDDDFFSLSNPYAEPDNSNVELQNIVAELERQRMQSEHEMNQLRQLQAQQSSAAEITAMQQEMQALQRRVADSEQAKLQLQNEIKQVKTQKDESINMQDSVVGGDMVASGATKIERQTNESHSSVGIQDSAFTGDAITSGGQKIESQTNVSGFTADDMTKLLDRERANALEAAKMAEELARLRKERGE
jgi:WD40 repeat protein/TolA-binding protein